MAEQDTLHFIKLHGQLLDRFGHTSLRLYLENLGQMIRRNNLEVHASPASQPHPEEDSCPSYRAGADY